MVGDKAEALAIKKMFYNKTIHNDIDALKAIDPLKISLDDLTGDVETRASITAHKGNFGHTQTSSGAIEIVYNIL
jgi:3-oxoacyl-(acyl-carrier-protein) synthase